MKKLILLICLLLPLSLLAQSPAAQVREHLQPLLKGEQPTFPLEILQQTQHHAAFITAAKLYTSDSLPAVRVAAYGLIGEIGLESKERALRRQVVEELLKVVNQSMPMSLRLSPILVQFRLEDYSPAAKEMLAELIKQPVSYKGTLVRIAKELDIE